MWDASHGMQDAHPCVCRENTSTAKWETVQDRISPQIQRGSDPTSQCPLLSQLSGKCSFPWSHHPQLLGIPLFPSPPPQLRIPPCQAPN